MKARCWDDSNNVSIGLVAAMQYPSGVSHVLKCATRKTTVPNARAGLQTIRAGYPMQIVCVDIMGPLPETERGSKYVLVVADYYTKWVEVYGIPNQEATTVAVKLVDEMFCRFSPPEQLHSDQGHQFESHAAY